MNLQQFKNLSEESKLTLEQRGRRKIIITPTTWDRVTNEQQYTREDIVAVASCLMDTRGYDIQQQLNVLGGEGQLKVWLESVKNFNVHQNAYFCIYHIQENHWVVFSFLEFDSEIFVLYKDSRGGNILPEIKKTISDRYSKHELLFKSNTANNESGVEWCGLMCLKNFEIILEGLNERKGEFITRFESIEFCSSHGVTNIRGDFKEILFKYVKNNILLSVDELKKDKKFIDAMKKLIVECLNHIGMNDRCQQLINAYKEIENQANPSMNKVDEARRNVLEDEHVKSLINGSGESSDNSNKTINVNQHKIEKEFPDQTKTFQNLFSWIMKFKDNKERKNFLKTLSEALSLKYEEIEKFLDAQREREEEKAQLTEEVDCLKIRSVEELEKELSPMADPEDIREESVKTTEELLEELSLGLTWSANNEERNDMDDRVSTLRHSLSRVHDAWNERWRKVSLREIREWVKDRRLRSSRMKEDEISKEDVEETLPVIRRAHLLTKGGELLRNTQLLAALVCLLSKKGNLSQMATGEGKTAVIAMLAAANVILYNEQVDIITTNSVLAKEGFTSRRTFFELLGIKVSCNASQRLRSQADDGGSGARACYAADVVYGDMATFQFDFLRHECERQDTRGSRSFGRVIVDEVDSMLIDNASHIAKLASPFPGMDSLRYVHIKIWVELNKAIREVGDSVLKKLESKKEEIQEQIKINELRLQEEFNNFASREGIEQGQLNAKGEELRKKRDDFGKHCQTEYEKNMTKELIDSINQKIKATNPTQIDLIPAHLRDYASRMEDKWIHNALYAMYECHENEQYVLRTDEDSKETVVIPVDYSNTGVTLKNTQWSNGLHQFIQLKHNLRVTVESLPSSFISNVGYIKQYGNKVWGLTGTLGSHAETQLLSDAYDVSYAKIPTYKSKVFTEFGGTFDKKWKFYVTTDAYLYAVKTGVQRSVLIICKTIRDVLDLEKTVKGIVKAEKQEMNIKIKTYCDENSSKIVKEEVGPGEIIIATNIAGRGTDLRTTESLEKKGGLHVIVTFLPANQRVEDQAFGRTSRQGNAGSAQIILRLSDVLDLGLEDVSPEMNFSCIKQKRDQLEQARIEEVRAKDLQDIQFEDAIFLKFLNVYRNLREKSENDQSVWFLAMDLKEMWAFWLNEKDFRRNRSRKTVNEEFQDFLTKASKILGVQENNKYQGGKIAFNPYYSVQQAEHFLICGSKQESEKALLHAIDLDSTNSGILYSAFYKLFELEVEKGSQLRERAKKALRGVFFVNADKEKDETYKTKAQDALEKAKLSLRREINYMANNFNMKNESELKDNEDFNNIIKSPDNPLVKQLSIRYTVLNYYYEQVKSLLDQIEESLNKEDGSTSGLAIVSRVPIENFTRETNSPLRQGTELEEIGLRGLETIYAVREIHDVSKTMIHSAQCQIVAGLTIASSGAVFPPALIFTTPLASILISEGICDIVLSLISQGYGEFSKAAYIKGKVIGYAISLITLGVGALFKYLTVLDEAIKYCKYAVDFLRKCPKMQFVCEKIANLIEWLQRHFEKLRLLALIDNSRTAIAFSTQVLWSVSTNTVQRTTRNMLGSVITERIVNALLEKMFTVLIPDIKEVFGKAVKEHIKKDDLKHITKSDLLTLTNNILNTNGIFQILTEVVFGLLRHSSSWDVKLTGLGFDTFLTGYQIYTYPKKFCEELKKQLENERKTGRKSEESFEDLQVIIIEAVAQKIYFLKMQILGKYTNTLIFNPLCNFFISSTFYLLGKEEKQVENEIDDILEAYEHLGLQCGATDEEINSAYRVYSEQFNRNNVNTNQNGSCEENIFFSEARDLLLNVNREVASFKYEGIGTINGDDNDLIESASRHLKNDVIKALYLQSRTELLLG